MRWPQYLALIVLCPVLAASAADGRVVKVLQHYVDKEGRQSLSPSLYERDAYQARLRHNPNDISAVEFDVQWKVSGPDKANLKVRVEVRGGKVAAKPLVLEGPVKADRWGATWSGLKMTSDEYRGLGEVVAWRVTLWRGDVMLAEQTSFLW